MTASPFTPYGHFSLRADDRLVVQLKAMADPTRLRILHLLRRHGSMTVSDLVSRLDPKQSTVSHHLKILDGAGLIRTADDNRREIVIDAVARLSRLIDPGDPAADVTAVDAAQDATVVPHSGQVSA